MNVGVCVCVCVHDLHMYISHIYDICPLLLTHIFRVPFWFRVNCILRLSQPGSLRLCLLPQALPCLFSSWTFSRLLQFLWHLTYRYIDATVKACKDCFITLMNNTLNTNVHIVTRSKKGTETTQKEGQAPLPFAQGRRYIVLEGLGRSSGPEDPMWRRGWGLAPRLLCLHCPLAPQRSCASPGTVPGL